jgi:hypothetical protein
MRCLITFFIASFCKILNFTKLLLVWRSCQLWSTLYAIVDWLEAPKFSLVFVFCSSFMLLCMQDLVIPPLVLFSMLLITTQGYILFFTSTLTMDLVVLHLRKLCFQLLFFCFDFQYSFLKLRLYSLLVGLPFNLTLFLNSIYTYLHERHHIYNNPNHCEEEESHMVW